MIRRSPRLACARLRTDRLGVVVLRLQRGLEARESKRKQERELPVLLNDLRGALRMPDVVRIGCAESAIPIPAESAIAHLKGAPLSLWRDELPKHAPVINAALTLQKLSAEFSGAARSLDYQLGQLARAYNDSQNTVAYHDEPLQQYAIGRMLGISKEQVLPWVSSTGIKDETPFEEVWQLFKSSKWMPPSIALQPISPSAARI